MDITEYLTLSQAAKALGYSNSSTLAAYCREGRVPGARKDGKLWYIPRLWVAEERKTPTLAPQGGRGSSRKSCG